MKTVEEALAYIHGRRPFGIRPGLDRVNALLAKVNHPEKNFPSIHIAGTNGKGSTVSYLRALFSETGQKVGTFTSPFIECFNERIQIDQTFISDEDLVAYVNKIVPLVEALDGEEGLAGITEFEVITVLAFLYFSDQQVDLALIEVGLGGLYDSTNVIDPIVSVITSIGMDHTDILGETFGKIAEQKAGIIKETRPVVTGNINEEALSVIMQIAKQKQVPIYSYEQEYSMTYHHPDKEWGEIFSFQNDTHKLVNLSIPLVGHHQVENAGVAIQTFITYCQAQSIPFTNQMINKGLKETFWPARMERLSKEPFIMIDGAHNEHAMKRLVENMKAEFSDKTIHILFSALETKDIHGMIHQLLEIPHADILVTTFDYPKAIKLTNTIQQLDPQRISLVSLWQVGLGEVLETMSNEDILLVTGSLYFVSEVRQLLKKLGADEND